MSKLSGSVEKIPAQREIFRETFRIWKSSPIAGLFYFNLLGCWRINRVKISARLSIKTVEKILVRLSRKEYFKQVYAEGLVHEKGRAIQYGCLILGHRRPNGEPGYYATVYSDKDHGQCAFCSLVPNGAEGVGKIAVLTTEGWKDVPFGDVTDDTPLRVMLAAFSHYLDSVDPKQIPISEIKRDKSKEPPHDKELMQRLLEALGGKMDITAATVSLKSIAPHDMDFCHHLPTTGKAWGWRVDFQGFHGVSA